jgi:serine/threonine-protein kinase
MALTTGTRIGSYEVIAPLGAGGMGEVYRAHDSRLDRAVAMKVLPEAWALDPERTARLEREAKILASLNHPHIAAVYGFEEAAGRHVLVMELVEGETLADRLARGPMAVDDALKVAHQIADALEAAHEKGIIHRDLKPANVKITPEDRVKVLDFGLARLQEREDATTSPNVTHSPTLSLLATQAGVILGTAGYMSPEQAKGAVADHRSDLFSFGVVLYEMLTGRQAFHAETAAETMAAVLMREPELGLLPAGLNPRITELLRRCLEKNPRRRWQAAGDLRAEIEAVTAAPRTVPVQAGIADTARPRWRRVIPFAATAVVSALLAGGFARWTATPSTRSAVVRFSIPLVDGPQVGNAAFRLLAISPDGARVVYVTDNRLWSRELSDAEARSIPGTENLLIADPAFSPDGQSVVFVSATERVLKRIGINGGPAITLAPVEVPFSVGWSHDGVLYTQSAGIMRISPDGGTPETILTLGPNERAHGPQMLPDGRTLLFTLIKGAGPDAWQKAEVVAQSGSGSRTTLIAGANARYLSSGHLVFARGGVLFAVSIDISRLQVTGVPVALIEGVGQSPNGGASFDVSDTGSLVYRPGPSTLSSTWQSSELASVDEGGRVDALKVTPGPYESPRISPDGKRLAFGSDDRREAIIWIYDLNAATSPRRLTFRGNNRFPVWSADSRSVTFQSDRDGDPAIFRQSADVSGDDAERLTTPARGTAHVPESWSRQDDLLFSVVESAAATLWTFSLRDRKAAQLGDVRSVTPLNAEFSPDGRWIAYTLRGGAALTTIYVEPFPATGQKLLVSRPEDVGHHPLWSPDGNTLFYVPGAQPVAGVQVVRQPGLLAFGDPQTWPGKLPNVNPFGAPRNFDVLPDGKRFIFTRPIAPTQTGAGGPSIHVAVNWLEEMRARAAAAR